MEQGRGCPTAGPGRGEPRGVPSRPLLRGQRLRMSDPGCRPSAVAAGLLLTAALSAGFPALGGPEQAGGPPASPAPPPSAARDLHLTVHARKALGADETLGPLNLSVEVRDGVATVSGPVPSPILAPRVVSVLEKVQG